MIAVGVFYFFLFFIATSLHQKYRYFQFPLPDEKFAQVMVLDLLVGILLGLAVVGITWLAVKRSKKLKNLSHEFYKMLGPLNGSEVFFIAAFSALGEEFFFRGVAQAVLGLIPASLLFGLLHVGPGRKYAPWTIFAVIVGFLFGLAYEWRGNLLLPTAAHFVVNFVNLRFYSQFNPKKKA